MKNAIRNLEKRGDETFPFPPLFSAKRKVKRKVTSIDSSLAQIDLRIAVDVLVTSEEGGPNLISIHSST